MENLIETIKSIIGSVSEIISNNLGFNQENTYLFMIIIISVFLSAKLISWIPKMKDSWTAWALVSLVVYVSIRNFGI